MTNAAVQQTAFEILTIVPACFFTRSFRTDISRNAGSHQVAQYCISTTRTRYVTRSIGLPLGLAPVRRIVLPTESSRVLAPAAKPAGPLCALAPTPDNRQQTEQGNCR